MNSNGFFKLIRLCVGVRNFLGVADLWTGVVASFSLLLFRGVTGSSYGFSSSTACFAERDLVVRAIGASEE